MSNTQINPNLSSSMFTPPASSHPHALRPLDEVLLGVAEVVSRVWPLRDYVAINPYAGIASRTFSDARSFLQIFSDCELLMPIDYYRSQFSRNRFSRGHLESAISEMKAAGQDVSVTADQLLTELSVSSGSEPFASAPRSSQRPIRTIAQYADDQDHGVWSELIVDEISKFCASHFDEIQSSWKSPWKDLPLYQAWQGAAQHDRNVEILGLSGFRKFVASLPTTPTAAIEHLLSLLQIPEPLWESFLLCQSFSVPGWSAWAKYQDASSQEQTGQTLAALLAIRLAYDAALGIQNGLKVEWDAMLDEHAATFRPPTPIANDDAEARTVCLRATEIAMRDSILNQLKTQRGPESVSRRLAQMVFCIDVRSERFRRQIESVSPKVETFGFAGFFAMPVEVVPLGQDRGLSHVPVLIDPQFRLHEDVADDAGVDKTDLATRRRLGFQWSRLWKRFQKSAIGCFSFVETSGWMYAAKLLGNSWATAKSTRDAAESNREHACQTRPTLDTLAGQGVDAAAQLDLAESMLQGLGILRDFGRMVVFCGHASTTKNNPLAAGLDCGACGGHSGEPNARLAAMLLNQPFIRDGLISRGIEIPADTHFLAALHNTTTDQIEFFDTNDVPSSHRRDLEELSDYTAAATMKTLQERTPIVGGRSTDELLRRAADWSEVRPEWGLAGNAAFLVGPRQLTRDANFDGRVFLHSYDAKNDPSNAVLESIMTAPMVVAHWINMQYYASTVDNHHFGSGDKTIHNVVGGFGLLAGGGGDLMTGLPLQSLHTGNVHQHLPIRLQAILVASRAAIQSVIEKHSMIEDLVDNDWLFLTAIEDGDAYRYTDGGWLAIPAAPQ
ncbi:MAG: DUF2309 domain-containing protein [Planctomycetota bacterium]